MRAVELPLRAPYYALRQRVDPRGREEEGDNGGVAIHRRRMQRGVATLQWQEAKTHRYEKVTGVRTEGEQLGPMTDASMIAGAQRIARTDTRNSRVEVVYQLDLAGWSISHVTSPRHSGLRRDRVLARCSESEKPTSAFYCLTLPAAAGFAPAARSVRSASRWPLSAAQYEAVQPAYRVVARGMEGGVGGDSSFGDASPSCTYHSPSPCSPPPSIRLHLMQPAAPARRQPRQQHRPHPYALGHGCSPFEESQAGSCLRGVAQRVTETLP